MDVMSCDWRGLKADLIAFQSCFHHVDLRSQPPTCTVHVQLASLLQSSRGIVPAGLGVSTQ